MLIDRLGIEQALATAVSGTQRSSAIMFPPALDLPNSLQRPETTPAALEVPSGFRCPLGSCVMAAPVVTPSGLTYEQCAFVACSECALLLAWGAGFVLMPRQTHCRSVIQDVVQQTGKDPATGQPLCTTDLYPNLALRDLIQEWTVTNAKQLDPRLVKRITKDCDIDALRRRSASRVPAGGVHASPSAHAALASPHSNGGSQHSAPASPTHAEPGSPVTRAGHSPGLDVRSCASSEDPRQGPRGKGRGVRQGDLRQVHGSSVLHGGKAVNTHPAQLSNSGGGERSLESRAGSKAPAEGEVHHDGSQLAAKFANPLFDAQVPQ